MPKVRPCCAAASLVLSLFVACGDDPALSGTELPTPPRRDAGTHNDAQSPVEHRDASVAPDAARAVDASSRPTARDAAAPVTASDAGLLAAPDAGRTLDSPCATSGAVCDDFERGSVPDATRWKVLTSYSGQPSDKNRVVLDAQHAAHGKQALHVHTETNDPVYIETTKLPLANNGFFGRVLAYFASDPGARSKGHWGSFVGIGKKTPAGQDIEVRIGGQFDILVANYAPNDALQTSASRDGYYDDGARLPIGAWACFEFQFDGAGNQLRVWLDGNELERLHVTDWNQFGHGLTPDWSPSYERLRIGYQSWNADTPIDVWYDDVALATQRVGCP
ncbi:MAG: hypothetical protein RLZZ450_3401 [Pseudomonadota bacterium]|jgi:hypothetical protein